MCGLSGEDAPPSGGYGDLNLTFFKAMLGVQG